MLWMFKHCSYYKLGTHPLFANIFCTINYVVGSAEYDK